MRKILAALFTVGTIAAVIALTAMSYGGHGG